MSKCEYCGNEHATICPTIKVIEYFANGKVKRVEFKTASDCYVVSPQITHWPEPPINREKIWPTTTGWGLSSNKDWHGVNTPMIRDGN